MSLEVTIKWKDHKRCKRYIGENEGAGCVCVCVFGSAFQTLEQCSIQTGPVSERNSKSPMLAAARAKHPAK